MNELIAENLTFQYSENSDPVLQNFYLKVPKGSIVLITGSSGCGKSTLCSVLAGIYPRHGGYIKSGRVLFNQIDIHKAPIVQRAGLIGMMFQNPNLQFCMDTVENELIFCLENICVPPLEIPSRIEASLAFCEIQELRTRKLHSLSGGEKQKVMLACIAALRSSCILLDEPFANIDPHSGKLLCERLLRFQREKGTTMIIVDHVISNFISIADEIVIMGEKGTILQKEKPAEHFSKRFFYGIPLSDRNAVPRQAILSLQTLRAGYQGRDILHDLTINFYKGCMTAITGASGSGKSTLLAVLSRMIGYNGTIQFEGENISRIPRKHYAKQVGIIFQNPQDQFVANTVYEEIAVSLKEKYTQDDISTPIREHLEELGLWKYRTYSPYMLSQGQQRRLAVGSLLAYKCRVLLCDEPTYGQDCESAQAIMKLLLRRVLQDGLTVIFSTHDLELAESYSHYHYHCKNRTIYDSASEPEVNNAKITKSRL